MKNSEEFMELMRVMALCIGSPCNPSKLENTFKSVKNETLDRKTISKYLSYMEDAFLIEKSMRYDIKGRKYIGTLSKYYFQDIGLRNALLNFRQVEENHIMENVIYNELRLRGFCVDVGMVEARTAKERKQLEMDFVANMADRRYYIQSAFAMPDDAKNMVGDLTFPNFLGNVSTYFPHFPHYLLLAKKHKRLIVNPYHFSSSFWHADCDYE